MTTDVEKSLVMSELPEIPNLNVSSVDAYRIGQLERDMNRVWQAHRELDQKHETDIALLRAERETIRLSLDKEITILKEYKDTFSKPVEDTIIGVRELMKWRDQWNGRIQAGGALLIVLTAINLIFQILDRWKGP